MLLRPRILKSHSKYIYKLKLKRYQKTHTFHMKIKYDFFHYGTYNDNYLIQIVHLLKSTKTTLKPTSLNKLRNFPLQILSDNDNTIFELHSATHVTFPAPDRHGQSVFNPDPCNANQVTTPVTRVQNSGSARRKEETSSLHTG